MTTEILFFIFVVIIAVIAATIFNIKHAPLLRYVKRQIMTGNELEFFYRLVQANPNGYVFSQVAMSALIEPATKNRKFRMAAFNKISRKRVDYAIYTDKLELLYVVELDDFTHNVVRDLQRDSMLESAEIHTIRWHSKKKPVIEEIREKFDQLKIRLNSADAAP